MPEPYLKTLSAILVVYHRFQPGKLSTYRVLSDLDGRDCRDSSGCEDGGDEDGVRRNEMVWRMMGVCRNR